MSYKATSIILLCFSIIVAFVNILFNNYLAVPLVIPFAIACLLNGRCSMIFNIAGLVIVGGCVCFIGSAYIGIMIFTVASCLLFSLDLKSIYSKLIIILLSIIVFISAFIDGESQNKYIHALLNSMLYLGCSSALFINVFEYVKKHTYSKQLDQKYLDVLDDLTKIAHESIDMLKSLQNEGDHE